MPQERRHELWDRRDARVIDRWVIRCDGDGVCSSTLSLMFQGLSTELLMRLDSRYSQGLSPQELSADNCMGCMLVAGVACLCRPRAAGRSFLSLTVAFWVQIPGIYKIRHIGQTTITTGAVSGGPRAVEGHESCVPDLNMHAMGTLVTTCFTSGAMSGLLAACPLSAQCSTASCPLPQCLQTPCLLCKHNVRAHLLYAVASCYRCA